MDKDEVKGAGQKAKGAVKEAGGKAANDPQLKAEGRMDKAKGAAQQAAGKAKDAAKKH